jgi:crotonobetainyl-CoA:carnitine CoA-transferase CaiB-like acyl-CoA transferase
VRGKGERSVSSSGKPLAGIRILDLTWVYSGPYCTSLLLDLGAEVIKIEGPDFGDHTRTFPPFKNGGSGYFYALNRGKKSLALNLKTERGKELFSRLSEKCDMVVENFVPGVLERMGLGYERLKRHNPRLIYGSIHGFGSWGPYSSWPCVDPVAQAMGGLMDQSGFPGGPPVKTGPAVADAVAGTYLALGLVAAVLEREKTGLGRRVEVSMHDAVFSVLEESVVRAGMTGNALPRRGNTDPLGAPWDAFATADGKWIMVCSLGADRFDKIYRLLGREDIAEKFGGDAEEDFARRSENLAELNAIFSGYARTRTAAQLVETLHSLRIPCGIVKDVVELLDDPHLAERNMVVPIDHPRLGKIRTYNNPIMFDQKSLGIRPGENPLDPELGADSADILAGWLGLTEEEIRTLARKKILWKS